MAESIKSILVNYLFILVCVFFVELVYENQVLPERKRKMFLFGAMALCLIFSLTFSVEFSIGYIFDLRLLPFIIGILYGGWHVGVPLFCVLAAYRIGIGGAGTYPALLAIIPPLLVLLRFSKFYSVWSPQKRVNTMTIFAAISTTYISAVSLLFFSIDLQSAGIWLAIIGVNTIGTALLGYCIELIKHYFHLKEQLAQNEKLELVSQLAAAVSHEVRNPLTASRGFMQLLLEDDIEKEQRQRFLHIAISELDRAEGIIRDYLTFAKPSTEQMMLLYVPDEVKRMIDIITPLANMHMVHIISHMTPCYVKGNSQTFAQAMLNIAKNAVEAMPDGGTFTIAIECSKETVRISLSDTGIGMTKEQIKRLGEPYFSTKEIKGTGLGMMVTYRIVNAMEGNIHAASKWGQGTTFTIELPAAQA